MKSSTNTNNMSYQQEERKEFIRIIIWVSLVIVLIISLIIASMSILPRYKVWSQEMEGKAEFAKAEQNRRIKVLEATANLEAQKLNALSEIERAKGVAKANDIIGQGLKNHEEYLKYLWITGLKEAQREIIYIPTEANLPILEANRLKK